MKRSTLALFFSLPLLALAGCDLGLQRGDDVGVVAPPSLRLELRDDARGGGNGDASGLQEAVAVVHAAAAHVAGSGWHTIMEGRVEVDFLRLADHAADLGIANIPAGKVTQIRLYVLEDEAAYVVDANGDQHPLLTPSGSQSGIKVKGLWSIGECEAGTLVLTTNGKKAIHIHGRGADDSYILRPVIRADRFAAEDIDGCVPGGNNPEGGGAGDGDLPGGDDGDGDGDGDVPGTGDGDLPDGDGDGEPGCFNPESGEVVDCELGGGGDVTGEGDPNGEVGDGDGDGDSDGDGADGADPDGTLDGDGSIADGDDDGTGGDGDDSAGDPGDGSGGGGESELCYDPESGGFFDC